MEACLPVWDIISIALPVSIIWGWHSLRCCSSIRDCTWSDQGAPMLTCFPRTMESPFSWRTLQSVLADCPRGSQRQPDNTRWSLTLTVTVTVFMRPNSSSRTQEHLIYLFWRKKKVVGEDLEGGGLGFLGGSFMGVSLKTRTPIPYSLLFWERKLSFCMAGHLIITDW